MILATLVSGLSMYGVHPLSRFIPESEYGIFGLLTALLNCMAIPSIGMQMVFVQQAAAAVTEEQRRKLAGTARRVLTGTFLLWLLLVALVLLFQADIVARWQISNPLALWITVFMGLAALWSPVFGGLLQGQQNFFWMGWASMLNGLGRVGAAAFAILVLHAAATGMVAGILFGTAVMMGIFAWQTRAAWLGPVAAFAWKPWFARVVPLTLGFGAFQFMFSADPLFVQAYFDGSQTGFYIAAGTVSRALVAFTGPIVAVMFPKIVRSLAQAEKTDVMGLTLILTAGLATVGALCLSMIAPWLLTTMYKSSFTAAVPLLPWFAWGMVPLAVANVLVNDLLARDRFEVAPWLVAVALGYGLALTAFHDTFLHVIQMLGTFNFLFLVVALFFSLKDRRASRTMPAEAARV
jgi:O-antigen/teichoic acid export membrane protein